MSAYDAFRSLKRKRRGADQRFANVSDSVEPRKGFTLIELLVVMALIAILGALMIAFFPNAATAQREANAATLLQSWLNIAKQRALRDQAPRGVRLWVNNQYYAGGTLVSDVVTDCQYIEQPPDFPSAAGIQAMFGGNGNTKTVPPLTTTTISMPTDLTNGNSGSPQYYSVQPGDYFEINGSGLMHQILTTNVMPGGGVTLVSASPPMSTITVTPALPNPFTSTVNWRILRSPRVAGDETLKLPDSTIIDLGTNNKYGNTLPPAENNDPTGISAAGPNSGYVDILFAPNGAVISRGVSTSIINLWVRSPAEAVTHANPTGALNVFAGAPTLVSVFVRTGLVGAYSPDPVGANPYAFVK